MSYNWILDAGWVSGNVIGGYFYSPSMSVLSFEYVLLCQALRVCYLLGNIPHQFDGLGSPGLPRLCTLKATSTRGQARGHNFLRGFFTLCLRILLSSNLYIQPGAGIHNPGGGGDPVSHALLEWASQAAACLLNLFILMGFLNFPLPYTACSAKATLSKEPWDLKGQD